MPFAKRGDVVHSEATSGFNNQKKSLLINGLAALGDSLYPLHIPDGGTRRCPYQPDGCLSWGFPITPSKF
ncbi:hypothetical protein KAM448_31110 [Aeromonas caviae]|nr:hypothetical protein KAM355_41070 [Aeromonas caviae]GJB00559.1 hypothetical protein KAM359_39660 [Aeromonas caviae]GJB13076.1 hypothetical protein KAM362_36360 [Aeromonas caviae]GJB25316.1 hypothetical protein KAM365_30660 [Aeromonas caviae]GJB51900.1 hypothetical protein KAM372_33610 [Aeromonas caviae]